MTVETEWVRVFGGRYTVNGECWDLPLPPGAKYPKISYRGRTTTASRLSLQLASGLDGYGLDSRHTCDRPPCIRPEHLLWGTRQQNMQDAVDRGRTAHNVNDANPRTKLSVDQVRWCRRQWRKGAQQKDIAATVGVHPATISRLVRGLRRSAMPPVQEMVDECAEKHCDDPATLGMTVVIGSVRLEVFLCEPHFDALDVALLAKMPT